MALQPGVGALTGQDQLVAGGEFLDVGFAVAAHFLVVEADDGQAALPGEGHQQRMLGAARDAPRGPHVEQPHLAAHVGRCEGLAGRAELFEAERRRRFADQWRGHFVRVAVEADGEEDDQHQKDAEGDQKTFQDAAPVASPAARAAVDLRR